MEANLSLEWREDIIFAGLSEGTVRRYRMHMSDKETMPTKKSWFTMRCQGVFSKGALRKRKGASVVKILSLRKFEPIVVITLNGVHVIFN